MRCRSTERKFGRAELGGEIRSNILPIEQRPFPRNVDDLNDPAKPGDKFSLRSLSVETGIPSLDDKAAAGRALLPRGFRVGMIVASSTGIDRGGRNEGSLGQNGHAKSPSSLPRAVCSWRAEK